MTISILSRSACAPFRPGPSPVTGQTNHSAAGPAMPDPLWPTPGIIENSRFSRTPRVPVNTARPGHKSGKQVH
jgi:hypothetical protein